MKNIRQAVKEYFEIYEPKLFENMGQSERKSLIKCIYRSLSVEDKQDAVVESPFFPTFCKAFVDLCEDDEDSSLILTTLKDSALAGLRETAMDAVNEHLSELCEFDKALEKKVFYGGPSLFERDFK